MNRLNYLPALAALAFGMIPAPSARAAAGLQTDAATPGRAAAGGSTLAARIRRHPADALLARSRYLRDRRLGTAPDFSAVPAAAGIPAAPPESWMSPQPDAPQGATWTTVGASGYTVAGRNAQGRATALWVNPANGNEIWAGFAGGGLWTTLNGGASWSPLGDRFLSLSIGAIAVDTTTVPRRIYVGTGEGNFTQDGTLGVGVYFSTDGGATFTLSALPWTAAMLAQERAIRKIAIDPKNTNHLYVIGDGGLFGGIYSAGAITWTLGTGLPYTGKTTCGSSFNFAVYFTDMVIDPTYSPTIAAVYVAVGTPFDEPNCSIAPQFVRSGNNIFRSLDGGASFTAILTPGVGGYTPVGPNVGPGRVSLALARPELATLPQRLFALVHDVATDGIDGIYYAQNPATATTTTGWVKRLPSDIFGGRGWFNMALLGDPAFTPATAGTASRLFAGGQQVNLSNDGGTTLTAVSTSAGANYVHDGIHDLVATADGLTLVAATDGGIFRGAVSGNSVAWTNLNGGGLNTLQFFGLGVSPVSAAIMNGGTIDNDEAHVSAGTWLAAGCGGAAAGAGGCGDSGVSLFTTGGATVYQSGPYASVRRSADSGATFPTCLRNFGGCSAACGFGCMPDNQTAYVAPMALDGANTLYTASKKLYKYNGATFTPLPASGDFVSSGIGQFYATVSAIAAAPSNPLIIYVGTSDGQVWRTLNGGAVMADWVNLSASPLPASLTTSDAVARPVTAIAVNPADPAKIIVVYGGYSASTATKPGHFFRSVNATSTPTLPAFTNITGTVPDLPVESAILAPGGADLVFGMDRGIGQLAAVFTAPVYTDLTGNAPNAAYFALAYTAAGKLRAASHGRGVFELASVTTGPVPVPDGSLAGTTPFRLKKNLANSANLDATWDSAGCGSPGYNIYDGPLTAAALSAGYSFTGAPACNIIGGSTTLTALPAGSLFFTVSGFDNPTLKDSPASQNSSGTYRGSGVSGSLCGVTSTASSATCP
jgi:hypothetical protein